MTNEVLDTAKQEMEATVAAFKKDLGHVRTGRANTQLLDGLFVEYYGARTPLNQVAQVNAPEASLLVIQPYDKTALTAIERDRFDDRGCRHARVNSDALCRRRRTEPRHADVDA